MCIASQFYVINKVPPPLPQIRSDRRPPPPIPLHSPFQCVIHLYNKHGDMIRNTSHCYLMSLIRPEAQHRLPPIQITGNNEWKRIYKYIYSYIVFIHVSKSIVMMTTMVMMMMAVVVQNFNVKRLQMKWTRRMERSISAHTHSHTHRKTGDEQPTSTC